MQSYFNPYTHPNQIQAQKYNWFWSGLLPSFLFRPLFGQNEHPVQGTGRDAYGGWSNAEKGL